MFGFSEDLIWWITIVDLPALSSLFFLIWRTRRDHETAMTRLRELLDTRNTQMREAQFSFKLEAAKSYASISDMKELEIRLINHLLRIESKLDKTAMKTEALRAKNNTQ
ncbi:MAG: hypothetical protein QF692_02495 [Alphaproteobacteria bacterium]|jgi:phosphoenolpyruvate synthase/pyruvate phosphate dikinase|nr:hypothetical protein [Alphaproteobacteria bacterium]MDP7222113.1 hypothetical protein [Alphaproteobacteria bacterium]